jgi:lipopolysaccharide biosynthesis glycosyltransferase
MRTKVLVTLATEDRLDWAKQLFAGAYFKGGWQGDYMLLAYELPENKLDWFRNKGILIKNCQKLSDKKVVNFHSCVLNKFTPFTPEFRRWDNVVFIDSDIFIEASIRDLAEVDGFAACADYYYKLNSEIINPKYKTENEEYGPRQEFLSKRIRQKYDLERFAFNSGVMAFSTDIIEDNMLESLVELFAEYGDVCAKGDQSILNLFFYNKWKKLPVAYNVPFNYYVEKLHIKPEKIRGIMFHVWHRKPKDLGDFFYEEMKQNISRFELIDIDHPKSPQHTWGF